MFYIFTINSWDNALFLINKMSEDARDWAFRGQSDKNWPLCTRFEREAEKYQCHNPYWFENREHYMLQDFQRRAYRYLDRLPEPKSDIDWLSLIQHHNGPTRLLDFSYSFYISLFFAVETASSDSAIWAINIGKLIRQLSKSGELDLKKSVTYGKVIKKNNELAQEIINDRKKKKDIVYMVEPFQQHERLSIQKGLFLFPGNIKKSFEHNICATFKMKFTDLSPNNASEDRVYSRFHTFDFTDVSIIKIILPASLHSRILVELNNMNISADSLFPGLDGLARSLSFRFRELDYAFRRREKTIKR